MSRVVHPVTGSRPVRWWAVLGVLLVVAAVVLVALALRSPAVAPRPAQGVVASAPSVAGSVAPTASPRPGGGTPPSPRAASTAPASRPAALPEHLTIPAIGVSTDLLRLGLRADRTVEVPQDPALAGWFEQGPPPGQQGSSVVLGHVDSEAGPAVFHRLSELTPGKRLRVRLDDGSTARFEVRRVATYANEDFPAQEVYAGSPGRRALNLVTCGGWYDAARGGWQANVVVFTERVPAG